MLEAAWLARYTIVIAGAGGGSHEDVSTQIHAYRLDRWTGAVDYIRRDQMIRVERDD